jgi:gamma-glutamyltranspeptidase
MRSSTALALIASTTLFAACPAALAGQIVAAPEMPVETVPTARFYEPGDTTLRRDAAEVVASGSAVVTSADPRATAAGATLLMAGGSAADAALAVMIALTAAEPQSSGLGGGGFFLWHDAKSGKTHTLDGRERAPASARAMCCAPSRGSA